MATRALADLRNDERLAFACLLITDINTQNSLMLVKGDPDFIRRISYAHVEKDEIFDLPGVVSRKKQLIPYLTGLIKEMVAEVHHRPYSEARPSRPSSKRSDDISRGHRAFQNPCSPSRDGGVPPLCADVPGTAGPARPRRGRAAGFRISRSNCVIA